jgi:cytochrome c biogenesis protein CcdA
MQKAYYVYFTAAFMSIPGDVSNSKLPSKLTDKRVWLIILIAVAVIVFAIWFFVISDAYNAFQDTNNSLSPNCYSINGKQICPKT